MLEILSFIEGNNQNGQVDKTYPFQLYFKNSVKYRKIYKYLQKSRNSNMAFKKARRYKINFQSKNTRFQRINKDC